MPSNNFLTIALPVYNEEKVLASNVEALVDFCSRTWPNKQIAIVIADNASHDGTAFMASKLTESIPCVRYVHRAEAGKGGAIRAAWEMFPAEVSCFMDIDLSTDLEALPRLVAAIEAGAHVVYGSRSHTDSVVTRSLHRHCISFGYRIAVRAFVGHTGDIACGFKAVSSRVVHELLPHVIDNHFAFDRELVLLAHAYKYRTEAIPVQWIERRDDHRQSTVRPLSVARADLRHLWTLRKRLKSLDKGSAV